VTITTTISADTAKLLTKGSTILCDVDLDGWVDGFGYPEVSAILAKVSGDTATCTVNLPYSWTGPSGGSATSYYFSGAYKVTATYAPGGDTEPLTDYKVIRQVTRPLYHASTSRINRSCGVCASGKRNNNFNSDCRDHVASIDRDPVSQPGTRLTPLRVAPRTWPSRLRKKEPPFVAKQPKGMPQGLKPYRFRCLGARG
jgi:hypothetical protein